MATNNGREVVGAEERDPPSATVKKAVNEPTQAAIKRLTMEYLNLTQDPLPFVVARPLESNILEWHFVLIGQPDTPYEGGYYHGKITFPHDFPFRPPGIFMITPSGRFVPNRPICMTITNFHPEQWNPSLSVSAILISLVSFMNDKDYTHSGAIKTTDETKRAMADKTAEFNLKNPVFRDVFPEMIQLLEQEEDLDDTDVEEEAGEDENNDGNPIGTNM